MKKRNQRRPAQLPVALRSLLAGDNGEDVLYFLANAIPLRGNEYRGDERVRFGRKLIFDWIASCYLASMAEKQRIMRGRDADRDQGLYECACVLHFLHNVEKTEECKKVDDVGRFECGQYQVLHWIEARLLRLSGFDAERPHKTFGEQFDAMLEANPDLSAEQLYEALGASNG